MELNIYHLYPDVLNLYGDRGNVLCMQRRLEWRGMQANIVPVPIGVKLAAKDCDLLFIGGGQDFEQEILMHDLKGEKTAELKAAIEDGVPVLAICGGYQMLGQYYKTWDGKQCDFTGALDLYTVGSEQRMIGNYMFTCDEADCKIVGVENHSGKTYLGSCVKPRGKVLEGYGNNGGRTLQKRLRVLFPRLSAAQKPEAGRSDPQACTRTQIWQSGASAPYRRI